MPRLGAGARRAERRWEALRLLRDGEPTAAIAARLANLAPRGRPALGLSEKSAQRIVHVACKLLLVGILLGSRPDGLPEGLWPPRPVRDALRATPGERERIAVLRAWLENP